MKHLPPSVKSFALQKHSADESQSAGNSLQAPSSDSNIPYDDLITAALSADDENKKESKDNSAAHPLYDNSRNESAQAVNYLS